MGFFRKSEEEIIALKAFDLAFDSILSQSSELILHNDFLKKTAEQHQNSNFRLSYYSAIACVHMIYLQSIVKFGSGSKCSKSVAKVLRKRFETIVNTNFMLNHAGLLNFVNVVMEEDVHFKDMAIEEKLALIPGIWVCMAFEGSGGKNLNMTDQKFIDSSKNVTNWLKKTIGNVFY